MEPLLKSLNLPKFSLQKNKKGVRSLFSSKSYKTGQEILRLPTFETRRNILNSNRKIADFCTKSKHYLTLSRNSQFACLLALTRKNKKLAAYWEMLPFSKKALAWNIWFWDPKKLKRKIKNDYFYQSYYDSLQKEYLTFGKIYDEYISIHLKMIFNMKRKTFQEKCMFFRVIVTSRGFGFYDEEVGSDIALVPLLDLMNHGSQKEYNVEWSFDKTAFVMTALKNIKKNEELLDSYGYSKTDAQFLSYYGFVPS